MWMYDLTGGLRIGKLHKRVTQGRGAALHADAAGRQRRGVVHLLRRAGRRRPAHAHDRADRGRPRRRGRELRDGSSASTKDADGQVTRRARRRRRRTRSRCARRRRRERDRRVVRRRPRARRRHAPDVDPAGEGHPHHGAVVAGAQRHRGGDPGAEGPALGVRRAVGRRGRRAPSPTSAPPTPTTTARSTTRRSRPTTSSTSCARSTARSPRRSPRPTSSARGPGCVRSCAAARANAPPTSRAATRCARPTAASSRSPAASSRPTGAWPPTRSTQVVKLLDRAAARSRTKRIRLHGAAGWDAPDLPADLAERYGSDARDGRSRSNAADPDLAEPLVPGLPYSRAEVVYAARHEMARTVDDVLSRRTRARLLGARRVRGRGRRRSRRSWPPSSAGATRRARPPGRRLPGADRRRAARGRAARDRARRARRSRRRNPDLVVSARVQTNRGAPTPPIAFGGDRRRPRPPGRRRASRSTTRCATRLRGHRRRRVDATRRRSARPAATGGRSR